MDKPDQLTVQIDYNTNTISRESLKKFHNKQLSNGVKNDENTLQIVNLLGGIDEILNNHLDNPNSNRNHPHGQNAINKIYQLLRTPQRYQQQNKLKPVTFINDKDKNIKSKEDHDNFGYEFTENQTVLHSIFGEKAANKILKIFSSKPVRIMFYLCFVSWLILVFVFSETLFIEMYEVSVLSVIFIPNLTFWLLSSNRDGLKLIIKTFEFWIKIYYSLYVHTLGCIYYHHRDVSDDKPYIYTTINLTSSILWIFALTLWTAVISSFDAMNVSRGWKVFFCSLAAVSCIMYSIEYQFLSDQKDDIIVHIKATNSILSFQSLIADAYSVLAIFFMKQAFFAYSRKGRATIIKYVPFIKWIDNPIITMKQLADNNRNDTTKNESRETKDDETEMCEITVKRCEMKEKNETENDISTDEDKSSDDSDDLSSVKL